MSQTSKVDLPKQYQTSRSHLIPNQWFPLSQRLLAYSPQVRITEIHSQARCSARFLSLSQKEFAPLSLFVCVCPCAVSCQGLTCHLPASVQSPSLSNTYFSPFFPSTSPP